MDESAQQYLHLVPSRAALHAWSWTQVAGETFRHARCITKHQEHRCPWTNNAHDLLKTLQPSESALWLVGKDHRSSARRGSLPRNQRTETLRQTLVTSSPYWLIL